MKQSELQVFTNSELGEIKGFIKDGEPWFLAGSICRSLGLKDSKRQIANIKERFKIADIRGVHSIYPPLESAGGKQKTHFVSEPVLYELIFQSRKQKAIKFRAWVTTEVLPSLRKHGEYRMQGKLIHRSYTDSIKEKLYDDLSPNGKKFVFSNFQKMINKSLGLPSKNNKDELSDEVLEKLAVRENLVKAMIDEGKNYYEVKDFIESL